MWVGDEWDVTFQLVPALRQQPPRQRRRRSAQPRAEADRTGRAGAPRPPPTYGAIDGVPSHDGSGSTGAKSAIGAWGYGFDANSSPKATTLADGANAKVRVKMRATAEGVIGLPTIHVCGYDGTYPAGSVGCDLDVGWSWTVAGPLSPVGKADNAIVNASYIGDTIDDQSHGSHRIKHPGPRQRRRPQHPRRRRQPRRARHLRLERPVHRAAATSSAARSRAPAREVDVADLGKACEYQPKPGFSGVDSFNYVVRQGTDQLEKLVKVLVAVQFNQPPAATVVDLGALQGTDDTFELAESISDPQGDPISCVPNLVTEASPANAGTATIDSDCTARLGQPEPRLHR